MPAFVDYTNKKIGRLTFLSDTYEKNKRRWNVRCDCGSETSYRADYIKRMREKGIEFECTDCQRDRNSGVSVGTIQGRWTVLGRQRFSEGKPGWLCACACGTQRFHCTSNLNKNSLSCGCLARKLNSKWANTTEYPPTHGLKRNASSKEKKHLYHIRSSILKKCYDDKDKSYLLYGARGYTVCELWRNGARDFYEWAIESGWKEGCFVSLKKRKKEFSPYNCFIETRGKFYSRKNAKLIKWNGNKLSFTDWAKVLKTTVSCLSGRMKRYKKYGIDCVMDLSWTPCGISNKTRYINNKE